MVKLTFEEPPDRPSRPGAMQEKLKPILEEMTKHPGEWVLLGEYDTPRGMTLASELKRQAKDGASWIPKGQWEFSGRKRGGKEDHGTKLYGKFLG